MCTLASSVKNPCRLHSLVVDGVKFATMFAPPHVANAKAALVQAQGLSFLGPSPKLPKANNGAGREQRRMTSAAPIDVPASIALSSSAPAAGPEKRPRKKSDPVLSSSAPASVEGETVGSACTDVCDGENRRRRRDSRSTGNTRAPSPVGDPLFSNSVATQLQKEPATESPLEYPGLCINETHFGQDENEQFDGKDNSATGSKGDAKDSSSLKDGQESRDLFERTSPSSISASTISLQPSQASGGSGGKGSSPASTPAPETKKKVKKNRKTAWYQNLISPTYKSKCADFRRLFAKEGVPDTEMLIVDYSCALQRDILVHGRLYISQNYFCFHANIFKWETYVVLKCRDLTSMTKEKTALVIPNAIVCQTDSERYFFTSFAARDKTYLMLFRIWQNALLAQPMSNTECWRWIHYSYGDELGLSTDDELDYVPPEDLNHVKTIDMKSLAEMPVDEGELAQPESPSLRSSANAATAKTSATSSVAVSEDAKSSASSGDEPDPDGGTPEKRAETPECPDNHDDMKQYLDRSFAMDIDHLFTCMFTASEFYQDLQVSRKTCNMTIGNWERLDEGRVAQRGDTEPNGNGGAPSSPGSSQCKQKRSLTYTINLNHAMAKSCTSSETQSLHRKSKAGKMYSIRSEVSNTGVPYADTFVVQQHYCLRREGENRCRLKMYAQIDFRKPPWGFVKGIIEKNTNQGVTDFVNDLQKALDKEVERLASESGQVPLPITPDAGTSPTSPPAFAPRKTGASINSDGSGALGGVDTWPASWFSQWIEPPVLLKVLAVFVVVLLAINIYVLYSYWMKDDQGATLELVDFGNRPPTTIEQWRRAYEQSQVRHRRQLDEVSRLVDRTLGGVDNMRTVFGQLKDVIAQRTNQLPASGSAGSPERQTTTYSHITLPESSLPQEEL